MEKISQKVPRMRVDELIKAVNEFDKSFGLKLKHPGIWSKPEKFLPVFEGNAEVGIAKLVATLNDINLEEYYSDAFMNSLGIDMFPMHPDSEEFCDESDLDWRGRTYKTSSLMFRRKFLTCVLTNYMGRLEKIGVRKAGDRYKKAHSMNEKTILMIKELMEHISRFTKCLVYNKPYKNIILLVNEDLSFGRKNVEQAKLKKRLNSMVIDTRSNLKGSILKERFMDDDIAINNILQIAYMLVTLDYNGSNGVPKFKHIEGATIEYDLVMLFEKLGKEIIKKSYRKGKYQLSPLFKAFIDARPKIRSQYHAEDKDFETIHIAILALEYTKFFMCDKYVDKFIDRMLEKNGKK